MRYHPSGPYVLQNINLTIPYGMNVVVVGRSGAGKSTIAWILTRCYNFTGSVNINNNNCNTLPLQQLRQRIRLVPQRCRLFGDTVKELVVGDVSVNEQQLMMLLKRVSMKERVEQFRNGIHHMVSADCAEFSAGEQQLLSIAHALVAGLPDVLVFDETTSAVDHLTDILILDLILSLSCTVVSICHRLQHVHRFDHVVIVDNGQVVEQGPPQQLLATTTSKLSKLMQQQQQQQPQQQQQQQQQH